MNTFTDNGKNPLRTLSPRASASYTIDDKWKVNGSVGYYSKTPSYTILGYKNNAGNYTNKDAEYIKSLHFVAGVEFIPRESTRFTLEGFYKKYTDYPVSTATGISLANQGADFGQIGNEDILSTGKGNAVGIEFFAQQKLFKNHFVVFSATYAVSKFSGNDGKLVASAWDNRYLVSTTIGRKFRKGWEMGLKYRLAGGVPYTPFDLAQSRLNYATTGRGTLDNTKLNTLRLKPFSQFDFRIDKKINYKRTTLDLYFDVTNALLTKNQNLPDYKFDRTLDADFKFDFKTTDGLALKPDGSNAVPIVETEKTLFVIPTLGFVFEF
jgi:hypothetical protein